MKTQTADVVVLGVGSMGTAACRALNLPLTIERTQLAWYPPGAPRKADEGEPCFAFSSDSVFYLNAA